MTEISEIILLSSLLLDIYFVRKLTRKGDITLFDIISVFYTLYFVVIPIKSILFDAYYREEPIARIVGNSILPPLYIFLVKLILYAISNIISKRFKGSYLIINKYLKFANDSFQLSKESVYLYIFVFVMALKPIISYSSLSEDNVEGNLTYFYGNNLPLYERLFANMLIGAMPAFVLLSIKYLLEVKETKFKRLAYINIALAAACVLLSGRTNCFNIAALIVLYLYSCKKELFTLKRVAVSILSIGFLALIYFPFYQSFRMTKELVVSNFTSHNFFDVLSYFITMDHEEMVDLYDKATKSTEGRSFNVYIIRITVFIQILLENHNLLC